MISALAGGAIDSAMLPAAPALGLIRSEKGRLLGWLGDETPGAQTNAVFTATKTANDRPDTVERFLRAFRKGARDYHDAFTGPDEKRRDMPTGPEILAILAKYVGQPVDQVSVGIGYMGARSAAQRAGHSPANRMVQVPEHAEGSRQWRGG